MNATQETMAADRPNDEQIRRYVQRRASADEEMRIEEYLLEHPAFLDEIETEEILNDGLASPDPIAASADGATNGDRKVVALQPRIKAVESLLRWSMAASILLAVGLVGALLSLHGALKERDSLRAVAALARNPLGNVPVIWLGALRGAESITTIPRLTDGTPVVLSIAIADQTATRYRMSLLTPDSSTPTVVVDNLVPQADGSLSVALPTNDIPPGKYSIVAIGTWIDGEREVLRLPVQVL